MEWWRNGCNYLLKNENTEVIFDTPLIEEAINEGLSDEIPIE